MPELQCNKCLKIFYRTNSRHNRNIKHGRKLTFCSRKCSDEFRKARKIELKCDECGKTIYRSPIHYNRHKTHFCGTSCNAKYHNRTRKSDKISYCKLCNKQIINKSIYGYKKKYCSTNCKLQAHWNRLFQNIEKHGLSILYTKNGYFNTNRAKEYLFYKYGNKCQICGYSEWYGKKLSIQLHHKDGNNTNNNIDNLQLLCPNCHSLTNTYCGKNRS